MARLFPAGGDPKTVVINSSRHWVAPAGIFLIDADGYGQRGTDADSQYVEAYTGGYLTVTYYRDGRQPTTSGGSIPFTYGSVPSDYCEAAQYSSGAISKIETCYSFTDQSYYEDYPASYGASATAFQKVFPGSYGNVPQNTVEYKNIAVVPGNSYFINVPSGGVVRITYIQ